MISNTTVFEGWAVCMPDDTLAKAPYQSYFDGTRDTATFDSKAKAEAYIRLNYQYLAKRGELPQAVPITIGQAINHGEWQC